MTARARQCRAFVFRAVFSPDKKFFRAFTDGDRERKPVLLRSGDGAVCTLKDAFSKKSPPQSGALQLFKVTLVR